MSSPAVEPRKKRGCLGCLARGCLALVALAVASVIAVIALAIWARPGAPDPKTLTVAADAASGASAAGASGAPAPAQNVDRIELSLASGEFTIEPGPPGSAPTAVADADAAAMDLVQELVQGDHGLTWRVRFGPRHGFFGHVLGGRRAQGKVRVTIPRGLPIALDVRTRLGRSTAELGGLSLTDVSWHDSFGEHSISFGEPLAAPLRSFSLQASTSGTRVSGLGNASPQAMTLRSRFGELDLGLEGPWKNACTADVRFTTGAVKVSAPPGVNLVRGDIAVKPGNVVMPMTEAPASPDAAATSASPEIVLNVHGRFGELRVQ